MHTKHPIKLGTSKFVDTRDKKAISSFVVMAMTGSKGSVTQGKQMIIAKALVTKQDNSIVPFPIFNSMSKGLSTMEYFLSTSGSRKGLINKSQSVPKTGYFTAKLIKACRDILITEEDCGTEKYLEMELCHCYSRTLAEPLGEYEKGELIGYFNHEELMEEFGANKVVKVYSPALCESTSGICSKCYGSHLGRMNDFRANIGLPAGILAGHSLSEPSTQLTLRMFHTSGSSQLNIQEIRAEDDCIVKFESLEGDLIKFTYGDKFWVSNKNSFDVKVKLSEEGTANAHKGQLVASIILGNLDIVSKMPRLEQVVEVRNGDALLSPMDGHIDLENIEWDEDSNQYLLKIRIWNEDDTATYYFGSSTRFKVPFNSEVRAGTQIVEGKVSWKQLYDFLPYEEFVNRFVDEIHELYSSEGAAINKKHYEVVLNALLQEYVVEDSGSSLHVKGSIVNKSKLKGATGTPLIKGLTQAAKSKSLIQRISVGWVKEALTEALLGEEIGNYESDRVAMGSIPRVGSGTNKNYTNEIEG